MQRKNKLIATLLIFTVLCSGTFYLGYTFAAPASTTTILEQGGMTEIYTYLISIDGSNYIVKDGETGEIVDEDADVAESMQYCIDAADTQTTIGFSDGTFVASSRVDMTEGNLAFIGAGQGNTIIKLGYEGDLFYSNDGGDNILFKDLSINGDKASRNTGILIHIIENQHINFENIEVYNAPQNGIECQSCQYIRLVDSYIHDNDEGSEEDWEAGVRIVNDVSNVLVQNCFFEDNNFDGLWIVDTCLDAEPPVLHDIVIADNIWKGNRNGPYVGVYANAWNTRGHDVTITGNVAYGNTNDGILVIRMEGVTVTGNTCYNETTGDGIVLDNCKNTVVSSNNLHGNTGMGIYITDCTDATMDSKNHLITNNICWNNGDGSSWESVGIIVTGSTYVFVNGNKCFDTRSGVARTQEYGIEVYWGAGECNDHSDYIVISENDVRGNSVGGVNLQDDQGHNTVSDNYS